MYLPRIICSVVVTTTVYFIAISALSADEWPQWRGPNRDGVWNEKGVLDKFSEPQVKLRWRASISSGYSGPTVAEGRVYVTDRVAKPQQTERVLCFDWKTGDQLWNHAYECPYIGVGYNAGPRASVTIDDGLAYALGTMGHLLCLDAARGHVIWKKTPGVDYQIRLPIWGSPLRRWSNTTYALCNSARKTTVALWPWTKRPGRSAGGHWTIVRRTRPR